MREPRITQRSRRVVNRLADELRVLGQAVGDPAPVVRAPSGRVVRCLEEQLADARAGRVRAVAIAVVLDDGATATVYANASDARAADLHYAAAHPAGRTLYAELDEDGDDEPDRVPR